MSIFQVDFLVNLSSQVSLFLLAFITAKQNNILIVDILKKSWNTKKCQLWFNHAAFNLSYYATGLPASG